MFFKTNFPLVAEKEAIDYDFTIDHTLKSLVTFILFLLHNNAVLEYMSSGSQTQGRATLEKNDDLSLKTEIDFTQPPQPSLNRGS